MNEIAPVTQRSSLRQCQRGAVAVLTGLMIAVLVGFVGLVVDLGRLFVIKSEIQTAMDACALAAATQLRPGLTDLTALNNAVALGRLMSDPDRSASGLARPAASVNRANFQDDLIEPASVQVTFSATLGGTYYAADSITPANARFARCTYPKEKIPVLFMRVLPGGAVSADVAATAVATMTPAQSTCAIPVALCQINGDRADDYGLRKGMWQRGRTDNKTPYGPGDFGWVNFPTSDRPPECPTGGGADYIGCLMRYGQCDLRTNDPVAEQDASGAKAALAVAWNSRFGYYATGGDRGPLPDRTGYGYTDFNWGNPGGVAANAAYDGTSLTNPGLPNYRASYTAYSGYQGDVLAGIDTSPPVGSYLTTDELKVSDIRNRRLVVTPIVDCGKWNVGAIPTINDWGCVLMLAPTGQADADFKPQIEFLGLASKPGSPCSSVGLPGGSIGPLVPGLVQ